MDEPLSNLDAQLRQEMRAEIRHLQRQLGITMVYVTHDQVEAMSMADRVVLLNRGKIEQNATPVELYERPANTFVARFIGTPPMNLAAARARRGRRRDRRHRRARGCARRLRGADAWRAARAHRARLRPRRDGDGCGNRISGRRLARHLPIGVGHARRARSRQRRPVARRSRAPFVGARRAAPVRTDGTRRADPVHEKTATMFA